MRTDNQRLQRSGGGRHFRLLARALPPPAEPDRYPTGLPLLALEMMLNPFKSPAEVAQSFDPAPMHIALTAFAIVLFSALAYSTIPIFFAVRTGSSRDFIIAISTSTLLISTPVGLAIALTTYFVVRYRWLATNLAWFLLFLLTSIPLAMEPKYVLQLVFVNAAIISATVGTAVFAIALLRRRWLTGTAKQFDG